VFCGVTVWAQKKGDAVASDSVLPLSERVAHAMISYFDYIRVLVFPWHLSVYYPYEHREPVMLGIAAAAGLALITGLAFALAARRAWLGGKSAQYESGPLTRCGLALPRPYLAVGWLWFVGMLVPVIGLVQVGGQGWADRYLYLPCIGFFIAVIWAGAELAARISAIKLLFPVAVAALVAVTLSEFRYWRDTTTLFGRALEVTHGNYLAMTLVGSMDADKGQLDDAIQLYRKALAIKPTYPEAHFFLGRALERKGQMDEALAEFNRALRLRPEFDAANVMVGLALARENKFDAAIAHYQVALKNNPESAAAQSDWGNALMKQGKWPESVAHYEAALRLDDSLAEAHNNLGIGYMQAGRLADGVAQLRAALKLNPNDAETKYNLGQALNQEQKWNEAYEVLSPLAAEAPSDFNTQFQCGLALEHLGQTRDAMSHYAAALLKNPDFPEALQHLAWIAATDARAEFRNGEQAVALASHACELTGQKRPAMLLTLAAAYGEVGKFDDGLATLEKVIDLAQTSHQQQLVTQAEGMRKLFQQRKPFRGWEESK
jgi:tetratricopeptide (TPR) repeat protein